MGIIKKTWAAEQTIMNAASVTTGTLSTDVDLETDGYEGAQVQVEGDFPGGPSDDLILEILASLDGTNYDDTPIQSITISKDTDPNQITFLIRDLTHFKINAKRSGSTDTITVTIKVQRWRWNSA